MMTYIFILLKTEKYIEKKGSNIKDLTEITENSKE